MYTEVFMGKMSLCLKFIFKKVIIYACRTVLIIQYLLDKYILPFPHPRKVAKLPEQFQNPITTHWIQKASNICGIFGLKLPCPFWCGIPHLRDYFQTPRCCLLLRWQEWHDSRSDAIVKLHYLLCPTMSETNYRSQWQHIEPRKWCRFFFILWNN